MIPLRMISVATVLVICTVTSRLLALPSPQLLDELVNPEELGEYFEGDIMDILPDGSNIEELKNAIRDKTRRWTHGIIPVRISDEYDEDQLSVIQEAIDQYHERTCIRIVPWSGEENYVHIKANSGCSSYVGMRGGEQTLSLAIPGCIRKGTIMHEFMHASGFWHEQSRTDRDHYVTTMWDNVKEGKEHNFKSYSQSTIDYLGQDYDYSSIMHYGKTAFAIDKSKPTIQTVDEDAVIGQRTAFSDVDLTKLNVLYECEWINENTGIGR